MSNLCFLHPVGFAGHVVHFDASGAQNVDALFFMLEWPGTVSIKSTAGHITPNLCFSIRWNLQVMECISVLPVHKMSMHYFSYLDGAGAVYKKSASGHITPNLCFSSGRICGSHCAFRCSRGTKCRRTIFHT
jgi:hypothetical protein